MPKTVTLDHAVALLTKLRPSLHLKLRRLHRELKDYAPPAVTSRYTEDLSESSREPWWARKREDDIVVEADHKAVVRVKTHAEDLADLTTPKVCSIYCRESEWHSRLR